ncbi:MAG: ATP-binding protein [Treponema sp.]|nr:ATP-binding protein [Treponema sp.]
MAEEKTGNFFSSFLNNFLNSGKIRSTDESLRYNILNIAILAGGLFLVIFGTSVTLEGNIPRGISDYAMAALCFIILFLLRTKLPLQIPGGIVVGAFGIMCTMFVSTGELHGFASLWIFSFPLLAIFVLGMTIGLIFSVLLLCAVVTFTIIPGLAGISYHIDSATRLIGVYFLVTLLTVIYEQSRLIKDSRVSRLNHELRVERDVITAMKDNLPIGMFLMNREYIIQGAYSKPLEDILGTDKIEGEKITDFLTASLKAKERDIFVDYLKMVLERQFDAKMLEDINPIKEFTYTNNYNNRSKIIRTVFSTVDQGLNDFYVLGTMEDISETRELERKLAEEATKRDEEMKDLFQVIQVDPAVFGDFIEDTEYEFDHINEILKNKSLSAKDAMVNIYQSVHAIKSNALILGLDNFSTKLHNLEDVIRQYRDGDDITFENVLHITIELEKIMKEKDKFRIIIDKIESFRAATGGRSRQDQYVLVETLFKACENAARTEGKEVGFFVDQLDETILENGPRRVIKEVLTQLVRNSVAHGIEMPEERKESGKESQGRISLSIVRESNQIHLKLSDDGKGINLNKIKEKALELKLLSKEDAEEKKNLLQVIFSPGFSTADATNLNAGRGIGLNLVRERLKELHGSIKISSEPGKGTCFDLFIPGDNADESKDS